MLLINLVYKALWLNIILSLRSDFVIFSTDQQLKYDPPSFFQLRLAMFTATPTPTKATCEALKRVGFSIKTLLSWGESGDLITGQNGGGVTPAPLVCELFAALPSTLEIALPHPIYNTVERTHTLTMTCGATTSVGYIRTGVHHVQFKERDANPAEALARLYLALKEAGHLGHAPMFNMPLHMLPNVFGQANAHAA